MTELDRLLVAQRGVVRAAQLLDCGFSGAMVAVRVRSQQWHRLFHGVYAIPPYDEEWDVLVLRGALLYAGSGAAVCHLSRLSLEGVAVSALERVHVGVPRGRDVRSTSGLVVHQVAGMVTETDPRWPDLPLLSVARSLCQAYAVTSSVGDRRALACAVLVPRLTTPAAISREAPPTMPRRRELLETADFVLRGCHSGLEIEFYVEVELRYRLPTGERQVPIATRAGTFVVDVLYRAARLVVEIDGRHHELDPAQRRADEMRDAHLRALGYRVIRVTARDLRNPAALAARFRRLLAEAA